MEHLLWSKKPALKILSRCWYNNICSGYPELEPDPCTIIPPHHSPGSILLSNTIKQFVLNINITLKICTEIWFGYYSVYIYWDFNNTYIACQLSNLLFRVIIALFISKCKLCALHPSCVDNKSMKLKWKDFWDQLEIEFFSVPVNNVLVFTNSISLWFYNYTLLL